MEVLSKSFGHKPKGVHVFALHEPFCSALSFGLFVQPFSPGDPVLLSASLPSSVHISVNSSLCVRMTEKVCRLPKCTVHTLFFLLFFLSFLYFLPSC